MLSGAWRLSSTSVYKGKPTLHWTALLIHTAGAGGVELLSSRFSDECAVLKFLQNVPKQCLQKKKKKVKIPDTQQDLSEKSSAPQVQ